MFTAHPPRTAEEHATRRAILSKILSHGTPAEMNAFVDQQRRRAMAQRQRPSKLRGFMRLLDIAK